MPQSEDVSESSRTAKVLLILLSVACTIIVIIHEVYRGIIGISQLLTWRLVLIALAGSSLMLLTFKRNVLAKEFDVRLLQLWMIYGLISTILNILVQLLFSDATGLILFLDASLFLFGSTIGMPFLWKSQSHREKSERRWDQSVMTLSEMIDKTEDKSGIGFISITKILLDPSYDSTTVCPECGLILDFREKYDWYGPTAFTCPYCERIIHMEEVGI